MTELSRYSIEDEGYFGITLLNMGAYASHLLTKRTDGLNGRGTRVLFADATANYDNRHRALTIEGITGTLGSPEGAVSSLIETAKIARDIDTLVDNARP